MSDPRIDGIRNQGGPNRGVSISSIAELAAAAKRKGRSLTVGPGGQRPMSMATRPTAGGMRRARGRGRYRLARGPRRVRRGRGVRRVRRVRRGRRMRRAKPARGPPRSPQEEQHNIIPKQEEVEEVENSDHSHTQPQQQKRRVPVMMIQPMMYGRPTKPTRTSQASEEQQQQQEEENERKPQSSQRQFPPRRTQPQPKEQPPQQRIKPESSTPIQRFPFRQRQQSVIEEKEVEGKENEPQEEEEETEEKREPVRRIIQPFRYAMPGMVTPKPKQQEQEIEEENEEEPEPVLPSSPTPPKAKLPQLPQLPKNPSTSTKTKNSLPIKRLPQRLPPNPSINMVNKNKNDEEEEEEIIDDDENINNEPQEEEEEPVVMKKREPMIIQMRMPLPGFHNNRHQHKQQHEEQQHEEEEEEYSYSDENEPQHYDNNNNEKQQQQQQPIHQRNTRKILPIRQLPKNPSQQLPKNPSQQLPQPTIHLQEQQQVNNPSTPYNTKKEEQEQDRVFEEEEEEEEEEIIIDEEELQKKEDEQLQSLEVSEEEFICTEDAQHVQQQQQQPTKSIFDIFTPTKFKKRHETRLFLRNSPNYNTKKDYEDEYTSLPSVQIPIHTLSPYKTDTQYACPRFEIQRKGGHLVQYLWECNMIDKEFVKLSPLDYTTLDSFDFWRLQRVDMLKEANSLNLTFRGKKKKDVTLRCDSKTQLWKLNELCKLAIPTCTVWIPEILSSSEHSQVVKMELSGVVNRQYVNESGRMTVKERNLKGVYFVMGPQYERINVFSVTWNLSGGEGLPEEPSRRKYILRKFIPPGSDIYAICLQGLAGQHNKTALETSLHLFFEKEMKCQMISSCTAGAIGLFVYCHHKKVRRISSCSKPRKILKSCVEVTIKYNESPIRFIGVSLPSTSNNNEQKMRLLQQMFLELEVSSPKYIVHHSFVLGDLQYEMALPPEIAVAYLRQKKSIVPFDGFVRHRQQSSVLHGYKEGEIHFLPTYPIEPDEKSLRWKYMSHQMLSYGGRILLKSLPNMNSEVIGYNANYEVHSVSPYCPVFSLVSIDTQRCHISHFSRPSQSREIRFDGLYIGGYNEGPLREPQLCFLGEWIVQSPCVSVRPRGETQSCPKFSREDLPVITPVKTWVEFMASSYLKIQLVDGGKVKGQAILPVVRLFRKEQIEKGDDLDEGGKEGKGIWFTIPIYSGSMKVGELMGSGKIISFLKMRKKV